MTAVDERGETLPAAVAPTLRRDATVPPSTLPGDASTQRHLTPLRKGDLVHRYLIVEQLGMGGMGVVYAAYDPELDRKIALKFLLPHIDASAHGDSAASARFQREAQALAKLDHPNVVKIYDVGVLEGRVYLAMEFVEGKTLRAWMQSARHSWREILAVILAAGEGLSAAHTRGIIHRDVKPDNIMIGRDGRVRVMDFGLASNVRRADACESDQIFSDHENHRGVLTRTGAIMGTPAYMAPEQFSGEPADARTDQFSLCATAWEALFKQRAFAGESFGELALSVTYGRLAPVPARNSVPAWLRKALERGLSAAPNARFADVSTLLGVLRKDPTRRRWALALLGSSLAAVGGIYGIQEFARQEAIGECQREGASVFDDWNENIRNEIERSFVAAGKSQARGTFARAAEIVDRWTFLWRDAAIQSCLNTNVDRVWDQATASKSSRCIKESRLELLAFLDSLTSPTELAANFAVTNALGLTPPETCLDHSQLARRPALSPEQEVKLQEFLPLQNRAITLEMSGRYIESLQLAEESAVKARAMQQPLIQAGAELRVGLDLEHVGKFSDAEASLLRALSAAREARSLDKMSEICTRLAFVVGVRLNRPSEGIVWGHAAKNLLTLSERNMPADDAHLNHVLAVIYQSLGDFE